MSQPSQADSVLTPTNVTEVVSRSLLFYSLSVVILVISAGLHFGHLGDANCKPDIR